MYDVTSGVPGKPCRAVELFADLVADCGEVGVVLVGGQGLWPIVLARS